MGLHLDQFHLLLGLACCPGARGLAGVAAQVGLLAQAVPTIRAERKLRFCFRI